MRIGGEPQTRRSIGRVLGEEVGDWSHLSEEPFHLYEPLLELLYIAINESKEKDSRWIDGILTVCSGPLDPWFVSNYKCCLSGCIASRQVLGRRI